MSATIALLFFFTVYALELVKSGIWFRPWIRGLLGDYAYPVSTAPANIHLHQLKVIRLPPFSGPVLLIFQAS